MKCPVSAREKSAQRVFVARALVTPCAERTQPGDPHAQHKMSDTDN